MAALGETYQQNLEAGAQSIKNLTAGNQAIGKSKGGNTTKIHMAVDAYGLPIDFELTGGEVHDCKNASEFIEKLPISTYTIADKGYDSEEVRETIRKKGSIPVIPRKNNSKIGNADMDWCLYKYRHLVENLFARIKHFRAVATRFDKLKRNYASVIAMACAFLWLPLSRCLRYYPSVQHTAFQG